MPKKIKRPAITLRRIITWLRKKPAKGRYDYSDIHNCLVCQFLKEQGFSDPMAGGCTVRVGHNTYYLPDEVAEVALKSPHTFGSALRRAEHA